MSTKLKTSKSESSSSFPEPLPLKKDHSYYPFEKEDFPDPKSFPKLKRTGEGDYGELEETFRLYGKELEHIPIVETYKNFKKHDKFVQHFLYNRLCDRYLRLKKCNNTTTYRTKQKKTSQNTRKSIAKKPTRRKTV